MEFDPAADDQCLRLRSRARIQDYINQTDNNKILAKLDWNINPSNNLVLPVELPRREARPAAAPVRAELQQHRPRAQREQPAVPQLRLRDQQRPEFVRARAEQPEHRVRQPVLRQLQPLPRLPSALHAVPFPTVEIGEAGVTYTTLGQEPFSIHNILDQDVWQFTDNFTLFRGRHSLTFGGELRERSASSTRSTSSGTGSSSSPGRSGIGAPPSPRWTSSSTHRSDQPGPAWTSQAWSAPACTRVRTSHVGQLGAVRPGRAPGLRPPEPDPRRAGRLPDVLHRPGGQPLLPGPDGAGREPEPGDGGPEQAARLQAALLTPGRLQLERLRRPPDPAPRRHRHLHRPGAVRVDRERDLQPGREPELCPVGLQRARHHVTATAPSWRSRST